MVLIAFHSIFIFLFFTVFKYIVALCMSISAASILYVCVIGTYLYVYWYISFNLYILFEFGVLTYVFVKSSGAPLRPVTFAMKQVLRTLMRAERQFP